MQATKLKTFWPIEFHADPWGAYCPRRGWPQILQISAEDVAIIPVLQSGPCDYNLGRVMRGANLDSSMTEGARHWVLDTRVKRGSCSGVPKDLQLPPL